MRTHIGDETNFYQPGEKFYNPFYCPIFRTYTGHEDFWMFGLLNAKVAIKREENQTRFSSSEREQARPKVNARLYSPYLGRFISPDPLLNSEGGPLDYNPYIYARNNPFRVVK